MKSSNRIHNKRIIRNYRQFFYLVAAIMLLASCNSFITVEQPDNQVVASSVFKSDKSAVAAINGFYSSIMENGTAFLNGGITIYAGMSSDELYNRITSTEFDQFRGNDIQPSNLDNEYKFWRSAYTEIYKLNAIIEGCEASRTLSEQTRNLLLGEARFMRGLFYFYLCNLYGKVPLVLSTAYDVSAVKGREEVSVVYENIMNDLAVSEKLLTVQYPTSNRARPNVYAVKALQAKVYLYRGNWEKAEQKATEVINEKIYLLEDSLKDVFKATSRESIFQLLPVNTYFNSTSEAQSFIPAEAASGRPAFPLTAEQYNAFENGDKRKLQWVGVKSYQGITYYYPHKYKVKTSVSAPTEYNVVLRLAEQYLIRAEARVQGKRFDEGLEDLNVVRTRAGLKELSSGTQEVLLEQIMSERRAEMFAELGSRWFDLKRTGQADLVLSKIKGLGWQANDTLYPIPQNERKLNVFLDQNKGYE